MITCSILLRCINIQRSRCCLKISVRKAVFSTSAAHSDQSTIPAEKPVSGYENFTLPVRPQLPLVTSRQIEYPPKFRSSKQAWLETLSTLEDEKYGIIDLHPDIFATYPRLDVLHNNVKWQRAYRRISLARVKTRAEVPGSNRKLGTQKGRGMARHGDRKAPNFKGGGRAKGPRGPTSYFYTIPRSYRALGLRVALSCKFAQNDLHIVDSLDIPTDDPQYLEDLIDTRFWGFSCLFVDDNDYMPENIALAVSNIPHFNLMPLYGLNVYSMLKHETLILTLAAVEKIEQKLLYEMNKAAAEFKYSYSERYREW